MIKKKILTYPEVVSLQDKPQRLIVFLHGLGSDGHDLIGLVPFISKELPDCYFIAPHGVEEYDMAPYGKQWFSVSDRDPVKIRKLAEDNLDLLVTIIQRKQVELNLTNKDTIIIGFSQGTMIGLLLNLIQKEPFACMIGFSGRLIPPREPINKTTPICLIHGELDDVIDISEMTNITSYLTKHNIIHNSYRIQNLTHSIDGRGLEFAINFIKNNQVVL